MARFRVVGLTNMDDFILCLAGFYKRGCQEKALFPYRRVAEV